VPLARVHDLKVQTNQLNAKSFIDPEGNRVGKTLGRGLKEFVEQNTDAMDVATYNAELRKIYAVKDVLEALNTKSVKGGRLGKYFSQVLGSIVGSSVGGWPGGIAGAVVGDKVREVQLRNALGGATGKALEVSDTLKNALPQSASTNNVTATAADDITNSTANKPINQRPAVLNGSGSSNTNSAMLQRTAYTPNAMNNTSSISSTKPQSALPSSTVIHTPGIAEQTQNNIVMALIHGGNKEMANTIAKIDVSGASTADDIAKAIRNVAGDGALNNQDVSPHIKSARQLFEFQLERAAQQTPPAVPSSKLSTLKKFLGSDIPNKEGGSISFFEQLPKKKLPNNDPLVLNLKKEADRLYAASLRPGISARAKHNYQQQAAAISQELNRKGYK
jgi:hypothetical protein